MPLDRSGRRDLARLSFAALLSLAPAAVRPTEAPAAPLTAQAKSDEIDAEMLRDREMAKRLSFFEPMRLLDQMTSNRPAREGATTPAEPAKREVEVTC